VIHSPFAAAFTPGTRFGQERGGPVEVSTRLLGELKVPSGRIVVTDPFTTSFEHPDSPLARRAPTGVFPVELAIARYENDDLRVACARVRFGGADGRAAKWEAALFEGQEPPDDDKIPGYGVDSGTGCFFDEQARTRVEEATTEEWLAVTERNMVSTWTWHVADVGNANLIMFSSGWGDGFYGSYWGLDANDRVVELVTDFDVLTGPLTERFELPLPPPRGRVRHPLLDRNGVTLRTGMLSRNTVILSGKGAAWLTLSDGTPTRMTRKRDESHYTWQSAAPDARLVVSVVVGIKPLDVL